MILVNIAVAIFVFGWLFTAIYYNHKWPYYGWQPDGSFRYLLHSGVNNRRRAIKELADEYGISKKAATKLLRKAKMQRINWVRKRQALADREKVMGVPLEERRKRARELVKQAKERMKHDN